MGGTAGSLCFTGLIGGGNCACTQVALPGVPPASGGNGQDGQNGLPGQNGANGTAGQVIEGFWRPGSRGKPGQDGTHGSGGGGGGAVGGGSNIRPPNCPTIGAGGGGAAARGVKAAPAVGAVSQLYSWVMAQAAGVRFCTRGRGLGGARKRLRVFTRMWWMWSSSMAIG